MEIFLLSVEENLELSEKLEKSKLIVQCSSMVPVAIRELPEICKIVKQSDC